MMTREAREERELARLLARLTPEAECFGLFGRGYPGSFYRVHVLLGKTWWNVEHNAIRGADPIAMQRRLQARGLTVAQTWRGPLAELGLFTCDPTRPALVRLLALARATWMRTVFDAPHDAGVAMLNGAESRKGETKQ